MSNPKEQKGFKYNGITVLNKDLQARQEIAAIKEDIQEIEDTIGMEVEANYIFINENIDDPFSRISGDVNGNVIRWIRRNSHRYLAKQTAAGTLTVCQLSDGDGRKFAEDLSAAALDGTMGDVIMLHPAFYTHAVEVQTGIWRIGFSRTQITQDWKLWEDNDAIGVYEGYVSNGKLYSRSGVASTGNVSQANFKAYARARGTGFTCVKWKHQNIMAFLYYASEGNTNCQATKGFGTNSYEKATGGTDALGMQDTDPINGNAGSINFWGLENWWGNKYDWVDNVEINADVWSITEDDGSVRTVQGQSAYNGWVYPKNFVIGRNLDVIPKPTQSGGTDATGYCDGIYMTGADGRVVLRGCSYSNSQGGVACANCDYDSSDTYASVGSRLAFKGTIVKASVADFKAATAIG